MNLRHHIYYSLVAITLLLSGCADDPFNKYHSSEDGRITMRIQLNTPPETSIITRSTKTTNPSEQEKLLANAVIMVFDKTTDDAILRQIPVEAAINNTTSPVTVTTTLLADNVSCYLCVAANLSDEQITTLKSLETGKSLSDIRTMLQKKLNTSDSSTGIEYPLPMSGWSEPTTISNSGDKISISLSRSVARIDVNGTAITEEAEDFIVTGIRISNGAPSGYVLPQPTLPLWDVTNVVTYPLTDNGKDKTSLEAKAYCFENKGSIGDTPNPTRVVVRGHSKSTNTDTWYPIDIIYDQPTTTGGISSTKKGYDIERNKIYTIKLNSVKKTGYGSYEQAARSEAFNTMIDAEITVSDPYAYDIITNGRQYMGVTNAEFIIYPAQADTKITNVHVTTLSYTSDPYWEDGSITCDEGITLSAGAYPRLNVRGDAEASYRDIVVDIDPTKTKSGLIRLQIGNLLKEIKVRVGNVTPKVGTVITDYYTVPNEETDFKVGEIISPSEDTSWFKVSSSSEDTENSSLNNKVTNPDGGIYLHVDPNVGFETSATAREASAYIAGDEDNQRIKITVQQDSYDVYYGNEQLQPYTYVGTYHRWNQTGERLIRIDASNSSTSASTSVKVAWWEATVVAGREFIVLDTEQSTDERVHIYKDNDHSTPNPYGEGDDTGFLSDDNYVEQYQVASKQRSVNGKGSYIYFRVGLTGKLSGPSAQPRYGLITISYGAVEGKTSGTHNIYVRQGEAADYLMRPWDPSTTPKDRANEFPSGTRPLATKLAVYNLADPEPPQAVPISGCVDHGTRGYVFTQYPSQGGLFFPISGTVAIDPRAGESNTALVSNPSYTDDSQWNNIWETCPKGYRRPHDGVARKLVNGALDKNIREDDITNSEVRQSLWLFPLKGAERSDFSNQLTGYLADGYFDRHPITLIKNEGNESPRPVGIVHSGNPYAAYRGYLIFNPHNYASIFLPFAGLYNAGSYPTKCSNFGGDGYISTKTSGKGGHDWVVAFGYISTEGRPSYVFDNYSSTASSSAYPIRCIKDELPPAITDDTGVTSPAEESNKPIVANFSYDSSKEKLETVITAKYKNDMQRINTLAINAVKSLTDEDFAFLNIWASQTGSYAGHQLRHLIVRGYYYQILPANAFTSANWYTLSLIDIREIKDSAFSNGLTGLTNLSLSFLDGIIANSTAFGFNTENVQLQLGGNDYDAADKTVRAWKGKVWKAIKQY